MSSNEEGCSSGPASVDFSENLNNKRLNLMEQRDYISDLPDFVIHHILSFLPTTRQAIRTGVLSKRWKNQWVHVPVLVFKFEDFALPYKNFPIIENILSLHQCSRVVKFECFSTDEKEHQLSFINHFPTETNIEDIVYFYQSARSMNLECFSMDEEEHQLSFISQSAMERNAEELILCCHALYEEVLPHLLFNIVSLVRLSLRKYVLEPEKGVKWGYLMVLKLEKCYLTDGGIGDALSGSLLLETLQLIKCHSRFNQFAVASKSLRELIICGDESPFIEIECPNLQTLKCDSCRFHGELFENISSRCPLLESLKLSKCGLYRLRGLAMSSKSLKTLSLERLVYICDEETSWKLKIYKISCPKLEKLKLFGKFDFRPYVVMNLPSLVRATLGIWGSTSSVEDVLQQLRHKLEINLLKENRRFLDQLKYYNLSL